MVKFVATTHHLVKRDAAEATAAKYHIEELSMRELFYYVLKEERYEMFVKDRRLPHMGDLTNTFFILLLASFMCD